MLDNLIFSIAVSTHLGLSGDFASVHPHVQYRMDNNYIVGAYHNSDKRASVYFGKRSVFNAPFDIVPPLEIEYGIVHGYKSWDIAPMIKVTYNGFFVAPAATEDDVGIVTGYELRF